MFAKLAGKEHDGSYGSGRFCSDHCRRVYCGKKVKHRVCNFNKSNKARRAPYGTWKCRFCELIFESKGKLWKHYHECHQERLYGPHGEGKPAWNKGQTKETNEKIHQYSETCHNRYVKGELIGSWVGKHHDEKTKLKISKSRSEYLINHPAEHPWKRNTKFKSIPCEKFKDDLRKFGYVFEEEYTDKQWSHNYSIDIAFPEKKIGIEINGQQHYDKDRKFK